MKLRPMVKRVFNELKTEGMEYEEAIHHERVAWAIGEYLGSCGTFSEDDLAYMAEIDEDPDDYAECECGSGEPVNFCCNYLGCSVDLDARTSTHMFKNKPWEVVHWG